MVHLIWIDLHWIGLSKVILINRLMPKFTQSLFVCAKYFVQTEFQHCEIVQQNSKLCITHNDHDIVH